MFAPLRRGRPGMTDRTSANDQERREPAGALFEQAEPLITEALALRAATDQQLVALRRLWANTLPSAPDRNSAPP
jgi:hypothetical protein